MSKLWSEFLVALLSPLRFVMWLGISVFAGLTGPFGTFSEFNFPVRIMYWSVIVGTSILLVLAARVLFLSFFPRLKYAWISVLVALAIAMLLTPLIIVFSHFFIDPNFNGYRPDARLSVLIFLLVLFVDLMRYYITRAVSAEIVERVKPVEPRLSERLPAHIRGDILHICGRDHQVEVRTEFGLCQIRLRLKDAIAEMEGIEGLSVHRSHWVTVSAVTGNGMEDNRPYLLLRDGATVPVSQKYADNVRARGLL
ncbi:MAG: DNA-binding protein [Rhodobacteraceae bacterium]|nr:DNA-binding protein [Paracoccaceae bacterium]